MSNKELVDKLKKLDKEQDICKFFQDQTEEFKKSEELKNYFKDLEKSKDDKDRFKLLSKSINCNDAQTKATSTGGEGLNEDSCLRISKEIQNNIFKKDDIKSSLTETANEKDLKVRTCILQKISELEKEKQTKIFEAVAELEKEKQTKIFEAVAELEKENQTKIFEALQIIFADEIEEIKKAKKSNIETSEISNDDKEKNNNSIFDQNSKLKEYQKLQNFWFQVVLELDEQYLRKIYIEFLIKTYSHYINHTSINKEFLEKYLKKFIVVINTHKYKIPEPKDNKGQDNREQGSKEESNIDRYKKQQLREALFRLIQKIKKDDFLLFSKLKLNQIEKYFNDFFQKFEIKDKKVFKNKSRIVTKWIQICKLQMFKPCQYKVLLKAISKNRIYVSNKVMFDFVLYISHTLSRDIVLSNNQPRYSYKFFLKHKHNYDDLLMLNEFFVQDGFVLQEKDETNNAISIEKLLKYSYSSNIKSADIKKYATNPNAFYIYYVLVDNPSIDNTLKQYISNQMTNIPYLYPYSDDILTIISHIHNKLQYNDKKEALQELSIKDNALDKFYLYHGYEFPLIEEYAKLIQVNKSKSLYEYIFSISLFFGYVAISLNNFRKFGFDISIQKDFIRYVFYLFDVVKNDYRLKYYKKYYFDTMCNRLKTKEYISADDYEVKLFIEYLRVLANALNTMFYLMNYIAEDRFAQDRLVAEFKRIFGIFKDELTYELYFNLRDSVYSKENYIFLEYRVAKLVYKITNIDDNLKDELVKFCKITLEKDKKHLDALKEKPYFFESFQKADDYIQKMDPAKNVVCFYLSNFLKEECKGYDYDDEKLNHNKDDLILFNKNWGLEDEEND